MKTLCLVIPCYNESRRLSVGALLQALSDHPSMSFLLVDDGSVDDTAEILAFLERQSPSIHALYLPRNTGKAAAVRSGINWALAHTTAEAVGFWDADLATPFSELPAFLRALEQGHQAVLGSRWPHLGVQIDRNVFRHCTGAVMKALIRQVVKCPVYDTQCGAKVFTRALAAELFRAPFLSRWLFDVEIIHRIPRTILANAVTEIPLTLWHDVRGSKLGLGDGFRQVFDLARIAFARTA